MENLPTPILSDSDWNAFNIPGDIEQKGEFAYIALNSGSAIAFAPIYGEVAQDNYSIDPYLASLSVDEFCDFINALNKD